jgi:hypothetical protein
MSYIEVERKHIIVDREMGDNYTQSYDIYKNDYSYSVNVPYYENTLTERIALRKVPIEFRRWIELEGNGVDSYGYWVVVKSYNLMGLDDVQQRDGIVISELRLENKRLKQMLQNSGVFYTEAPPNNLPPKSMRELEEDKLNQQNNKEFEDMFKL